MGEDGASETVVSQGDLTDFGGEVRGEKGCSVLCHLMEGIVAVHLGQERLAFGLYTNKGCFSMWRREKCQGVRVWCRVSNSCDVLLSLSFLSL